MSDDYFMWKMFGCACGTIIYGLGGLVIGAIAGPVSGVITGFATDNPLIGTIVGFSVVISCIIIGGKIGCIIGSRWIKKPR